MTATTATLATFILDRVSETEAAATEVSAHLQNGEEIQVRLSRTEGDTTISKTFTPYHPAVVLAQCAAIRAVVALHEDDRGQCSSCAEPDGTGYGSMDEWPCPTLRALARPWSDHSAYDARWA